jgi:putative heme-binding domain-containing protein
MGADKIRGIWSALFVTISSFALAITSAGLAQEPTVRETDAGSQIGEGTPPIARIPWTRSRIKGSPEPPPPFRTQRIFPHISFKGPTLITNAPTTNRLFVAENSGKIYSIPDDQNCEQADLFIDLERHVQKIDDGRHQIDLKGVYGLTFHPDFSQNRYCYIFYIISDREGPRRPDGTRVSRFRVTETDPPQCDPDTETVIISWIEGGHSGGCVKFGHDGFLYISTGDGSNAFPPDVDNAGQDVSNLRSSILRIDVNRPEDGRPYSIPDDNPFVNLEGARGEIWCYGLRNPWKMSFDRQSGELWVGDVGWELWEMVYRVQPGANYGWSLMEGRQPVHTERQRGPTPIVPPTIEISHAAGASVTGGFVYRGQKFPELSGTYVFGDWETRRVWGVAVEDDQLGERYDLAEPSLRVVGFGEDNAGEIYLLAFDEGTIHTLVRNDPQSANVAFPRRLSETGLYRSVTDHRLEPGVIPFSVNAQQWTDHATAEHAIGVPGTASIKLHARSKEFRGSLFPRMMDFPQDTVLAKTLSLELERGNSASRRRLETQILHFDGRIVRGYTYAWNDAQTDADLVEPAGRERTLTVLDPSAPGGRREQVWHFPSRNDCLRCHNPWTEHKLAFNIPQLNRDHAYGSVTANQIRTFRQMGLIEDIEEERNPDRPYDKLVPTRTADELPRLVDPFDEHADLELRARSYLHVNCAHCHRHYGGGSTQLFLNYDLSLEETKAVGARPTQGAFGIHDAKIIAPGDPYGSVFYFRLSSIGAGRMPRIGSRLLDERGLRLIHDWIRQLPVRTDQRLLIDRLMALDEPTVLAKEAENRRKTLWAMARRHARENDRQKPNDEDRSRAMERAGQEAAARVEKRVADRRECIDKLLATTSGAVMVSRAIKQGRLPDSIRKQMLAAALVTPAAQVRNLFEQFLPEDQRSKRLGDVIRPADILALPGDHVRGKILFQETEGVQCKNCHKIGEVGTRLGPDLTQIGKKYNRLQLLETVLQPSKEIDPKYVTWLVETSEGRVHTGLLAEKTNSKIVLRDARNNLVEVSADQVDALIPQRKSLMPDLLLRDMTAQQVADLLAYLASLKE